MLKVTVIMPAYNAERFLAQAIESVLAQTFADWELVIVDDGSTDGTPEILDRFSDPRIVGTHQSNQGGAAARNVALDLARGEFVSFLDADDLYLTNALGDMVTFLDAHPETDALFSDGYFCDENDRPLGRLSEVRPGPFTGRILDPLVLDPTVIAGTICTMTRRATIRDSGVRFDSALIIGEDWDFFIHLARHAQFGYLDRPTCMYRVHQTNTTVISGSERRKADLYRGRLKVMNATWFAELSLPTRSRFFYNLLIDLLDDESDQQDAIMAAPPFLALPAGAQANLLRLVASNHLSRRQNTEFALNCLRRSLDLQPDSPKSRVLLQLGSRSPALAAAVLSVWQHAHRISVDARSFGQRKPKPVPGALMPKTE